MAAGTTGLLGILLLALIATGLQKETALPDTKGTEGTNGTQQPFEPTRDELYAQFAQELRMMAGAEPYTKQVYGGAAEDMRQVVSLTVLKKLQSLVDSVVERAEDAWATADDAGNSEIVAPCVQGKEAQAEQGVHSVLASMKQCVEGVVEEGAQLSQQAADITTQLEELLKQLVTAVEDCLKAPAEEAEPEGDEESDDPKKEEKRRVRNCVRSEPVKELLKKKEQAYKSLHPIMRKVFDMEKQPPTCISDLFKRAEKETVSILSSITKCVDEKLREEL